MKFIVATIGTLFATAALAQAPAAPAKVEDKKPAVAAPAPAAAPAAKPAAAPAAAPAPAKAASAAPAKKDEKKVEAKK